MIGPIQILTSCTVGVSMEFSIFLVLWHLVKSAWLTLKSSCIVLGIKQNQTKLSLLFLDNILFKKY